MLSMFGARPALPTKMTMSLVRPGAEPLTQFGFVLQFWLPPPPFQTSAEELMVRETLAEPLKVAVSVAVTVKLAPPVGAAAGMATVFV